MVENTFKRADRVSNNMFKILKSVDSVTDGFRFDIYKASYKQLSNVPNVPKEKNTSAKHAATVGPTPSTGEPTHSKITNFLNKRVYGEATSAFLVWVASEGVEMPLLRVDRLIEFKFKIDEFIQYCEENKVIKQGEWDILKSTAESFRGYVGDHMDKVTPVIIEL